MLNKEEIEEAKGWLSALDIKSEFEAISKEIILQYIDQLEQENKKQSKIIDEMAKYYQQLCAKPSLAKYQWKRICSEDLKHCEGHLCDECIKQYFEKKVEDK